MTDFVALGLEAANTLIDHNFEKIPNQVSTPRESLRKIRKRHHNKHPELDRMEGRPESPGSPDPGHRRRADSEGAGGARERYYSDDEYDDHQERHRQRDTPLPRDSTYSPSNPRSDTYYQEAQRRTRNGYDPPYDPPPSSRSSQYAEVDPRYPAQQRSPHATHNYIPYQYQHPAMASGALPASSTNSVYGPSYPYTIHRPSSPSPPPPRRSRSTHRDQRQRPALHKRPSSTDGTIGSRFSHSDAGIGASTFGALAGGFLAQGMNAHQSRKGHGRGGDPIAMTLLGAVVGGLGANLAENAYERRKKEKERERERKRDRDRDWDR
jgi:hypothetical protein